MTSYYIILHHHTTHYAKKCHNVFSMQYGREGERERERGRGGRIMDLFFFHC